MQLQRMPMIILRKVVRHDDKHDENKHVAEVFSNVEHVVI